MIAYILALAVAGLASGFLAGLFGIGGGILRVPLFVFLFSRYGVAEDVLMHQATATSLALVIPSSIAASWKQHRAGYLDLNYFWSWAIYLLVGVVVAGITMPYLSTIQLEVVFILFLLLISAYIGLAKSTWVFSRKIPTGWKKGTCGVIVAILGVWTGTGGGVLTTPLLKACSYPLKRAIAMATATGFVIGFVGTVWALFSGMEVAGRSTYSLGYIDLPAFFVMLPTVAVMAPLGARVAIGANSAKLKVFYAIFVLAMAGYMIYEPA